MKSPVTHLANEKLGLQFRFFPAYAKFLLDHKLEAFVDATIRLYHEVDIPLLKFFALMPESEQKRLSMQSNAELLLMLSENKAEQYVERSVDRFVTNQLPLVNREQIVAEDLTMVNFVRRKAFRDFLKFYTNDLIRGTDILEEIDKFTLQLDSALFKAFISIQQEQIQKMNAALQRRERELLEAQEIAQIGSFEWDLTGKGGSSYSPEMFRIFEMDKTSNIESFMQDVHPDDRLKLQSALERAFDTGDYECEYRYLRNDKDKVIWSRGKVSYTNGKPARIVGTVMDVTERSKIVQRLQAAEQAHQVAAAITHIGNWSWVISKNQITWSDEMYRIYGLEPRSEEITMDRAMSFIHPDDRARIQQANKAVLQNGKVEETFFRIVTNNGDVKVIRGLGNISRDREGNPAIIHGTAQDVTSEYNLNEELKAREEYLHKLNKSLDEKNRELMQTNQELETFNFIASHDLQEPLRKIQIYSDRIMKSGQMSGKTLEYFERINSASSRMQKMIEDFLLFSQASHQKLVFEPVDLNAIMNEAVADLTVRIEEKNARLQCDNLPVITGAPFQLKQLLVNLLSNAIKFAAPGTVPQVYVKCSEVDGARVGLQPVPCVQISVSDNGIGFNPTYAEKIFELFQRLHNKDEFSGTGIGLALCKKIVSNHHGAIVAESEPGKGSTFHVILPVSQRGSKTG